MEKVETLMIILKKHKESSESTWMDKNRKKEMCIVHHLDSLICHMIIRETNTPWKKGPTSSFMTKASQCFASSSSQNLEYWSASIKFFNSPLSLTSTLIIHPFSYGLPLICITKATSDIGFIWVYDFKRCNLKVVILKRYNLKTLF